MQINRDQGSVCLKQRTKEHMYCKGIELIFLVIRRTIFCIYIVVRSYTLID